MGKSLLCYTKKDPTQYNNTKSEMQDQPQETCDEMRRQINEFERSSKLNTFASEQPLMISTGNDDKENNKTIQTTNVELNGVQLYESIKRNLKRIKGCISQICTT